MKNIISTITIMLLCICTATAQSTSHMSVLGIEIDGTPESVGKKLQNKEFTKVMISENDMYKGKFTNVAGCYIAPLSTPISRTVWKLVIIMPDESSWNAVRREYVKYKKSLTDKYGEPESYEFFQSPYHEFDGNEMLALSNNHCTYASFYRTELGSIVLSIISMQYGTAHLVISYEDATNTEKYKTENEKTISSQL